MNPGAFHSLEVLGGGKEGGPESAAKGLGTCKVRDMFADWVFPCFTVIAESNRLLAPCFLEFVYALRHVFF